jgi:hypothetical protein
MDAMVDGKLMPCNTFNKMDKLLNKTTHTPPETEPAEPLNSPLLLESLESTKLDQDPNHLFLLPLPTDQPQSPLKPTDQSSKDTLVVFSTHQLVEPNLITPSPPSDMVSKMVSLTTSLETHGVHHGEIEDTSTSLPPVKDQSVSAVSNKPQSGQTPPEKSIEFV